MLTSLVYIPSAITEIKIMQDMFPKQQAANAECKPLRTDMVKWKECHDKNRKEIVEEIKKNYRPINPLRDPNISFNLRAIMGFGYLFILWISLANKVKRWHDLDKSGWFAVLNYVPVVNIAMFIWQGFFKGTMGPNKYGQDPLQINTIKVNAI